jgi:LmbE family N-acetylglucosaminyl deacetylase
VRGAIVAVVAHPDDESLIAGGTLALAARAGARAVAVSLTRGENGPISDSQLCSPESLARVRAAELDRAARMLGLDWATCLTYPDGELPWVDHAAAAAELADLLARLVPDVVLTFGEDGLYGHPDHTATAEIVARAIGRLDRPAALYHAAWPTGLVAELTASAAERGLPHALWGLDPEAFGGDRVASVGIDIRTVLGQKLAALRTHRTQLGADHLLTALPLDLAERFLATEPWAGPGDGTLEEVLRSG